MSPFDVRFFLACGALVAIVVGIASLALVLIRSRSVISLGFKLGQIERRRQVLEHRLMHSYPSSGEHRHFQNQMLRLEAKEDRLLAKHLDQPLPNARTP